MARKLSDLMGKNDDDDGPKDNPETPFFDESTGTFLPWEEPLGTNGWRTGDSAPDDVEDAMDVIDRHPDEDWYEDCDEQGGS